MKIQLAEHYGLCFGVRDAIAQAEELATRGPLTILGELVHNPVVRERLARHGVREGALDDRDSAQSTQVMITAHGASDKARGEWRNAGFGVADGTCPLVLQAHEKLRALVEQGFVPVVIGKRGHVEVNGLTGDFPDACIIESAEDLANLPTAARLGVISQTTQPSEKVLALVDAIRIARPASEVRFCDTVCQPTKNRQSALRKLIEECDTLVVVGGRNSNNTLQLVAAATVAGRAVHHVERAEELRPDWFRAARVVGITAGTSTLKETVATVRIRLEAIATELSLAAH
ncbi:hydroxymethylbutenyl pyrophosphate reductase [Chthoniobacter flavus Ellin428]|uniref:4-hydroxy-3-methylbut-2-enyl diphosphate reductase n=1 Tax=Chthoniobacter flavus Ellin428 TaxID=497964 RepID=B4CZC4_9BACT|nr:4-hydroxy-3-methylbut-2-enyl diphosphate reductase [Chthoniobacter flavus]EDY20815.1 hydroxymethylbutenyl pyrophosphate reductase [Chthoniobacter flavus Ellin428]TCO89706.1 4-hydroxy-3-methylbut-2-enyl diphosphate reductase [Chthoniobacter flavus]